MAEIIVMLNRMAISEVPIEWESVEEVLYMLHSIQQPGAFCLATSIVRQKPTASSHALHDIIWLLQAPEVVSDAVLAAPCTARVSPTTVLSNLDYSAPSSWGRSLPITNSTTNKMPLMARQAVWYSFPSACSLRGQKIHPGAVQRS